MWFGAGTEPRDLSMLSKPSELYLQAEQDMKNSQQATPPWPLHQLLPPGSCPVWAPVLIFFDDSDMEVQDE